MTARESDKHAFLRGIGWGDAQRRFLAGDASDRSYDRLTLGDRVAVLMDAPRGRGDDPAQFVRVAEWLRRLGLSAPQVIAQDLTRGFLLLEDLGDDLFARVLARNIVREAKLYGAATDVLILVQAQPVPPGLPDPSAADWARAAALVFDWYQFALTGLRPDTASFCDALTAALQRAADGPRVTILRDYHAENLLWLPDRTGLACVGLLDFQLAQGGQPAYDLVSLLQDARRDVQAATEEEMIVRFANATGASLPGFRRSYAVLGVQRALRILGIFARLCLVAAKPGYLSLMPRVWGQLQRNLAEPGLVEVAALCRSLPAPTPDALSRIEAQCGAFR